MMSTHYRWPKSAPTGRFFKSYKPLLEILEDRIVPSAGQLDPTFGVGGIVTTAIGSGNDEANALAIDGNGKIVAAGFSFNGSNDDFALTRYNSDGSLDTSFGSDGKVTTDF